MTDPRDCQGAECRECGGWFRDDEDLNEAMLCESCERDEERYRAEEEAALRESESEVIAPGLGFGAFKASRTDWFALASNITGAGK